MFHERHYAREVMPKLTLQEQFIEGLKKLGEVEIKRTARKIVYSRKAGGYYYLGRSGSLRVGSTVMGSIPVNSKFKAMLMGIEGTI